VPDIPEKIRHTSTNAHFVVLSKVQLREQNQEKRKKPLGYWEELHFQGAQI
jgi:hypothetical protein